jgi:glycogen operon protein
VGWLDWSLLDRNPEFRRFVQMMMSYRRRLVDASRKDSSEPSLNELLRHAEIDWHGVPLDVPDWGYDSHSIACTLRIGPRHHCFWLHVMFNAYWEPLDFDLPRPPNSVVGSWREWIDTSRESPEDIMEFEAAPLVSGTRYRVAPRSVAALLAYNGACSSRSFEDTARVAEDSRHGQGIVGPVSGAGAALAGRYRHAGRHETAMALL